jgi:hypothetical protein
MAGFDEKVCKLVGFKITGTAIINVWGGEKGEIEMNSSFYEVTPVKNVIPKLTDIQIKEAINDGGFGCESIESALINIDKVYTPINATDNLIQSLIIRYKENINIIL